MSHNNIMTCFWNINLIKTLTGKNTKSFVRSFLPQTLTLFSAMQYLFYITTFTLFFLLFLRIKKNRHITNLGSASIRCENKRIKIPSTLKKSLNYFLQDILCNGIHKFCLMASSARQWNENHVVDMAFIANASKSSNIEMLFIGWKKVLTNRDLL